LSGENSRSALQSKFIALSLKIWWVDVEIRLGEEVGAMEEREKSSGSFFCESERLGALLGGQQPLGNLYPFGSNGTLSAALPHQGAVLPHPSKQLCWM
jgi:hypothetical protein